MTLSYLVDLQDSKRFSIEDDGTSWVHALPLGGPYQHPRYGKLEFPMERIQRLAQSVAQRVRGIDPDVDYDHKLDPAKGAKAAGWIHAAEPRADGLWLKVKWTPDALDSIKKGEYRYFSSEFDDWSDPKSGTKYKDVLFGGGLTNRPFIKDLVPINLSDVFAELTGKPIPPVGEDVGPDKKVGSMDEKLKKALIKLHGLPEDASDEQVTQAVASASEKPPEKKEEPKVEQKKEPVAASDLKLLAEQNPAIAQMLAEHEAMKRTVASTSAALRLSEVDKQLDSLSYIKLAEGETFVGVPKPVTDALRKIMVGSSKELADEVFSTVKLLAETGTVPLGEIGSVDAGTRVSLGETASGGGNIMAQVESRVKALMESEAGKGLSYAEATDKVFEADHKLANAYFNHMPTLAGAGGGDDD